MRENDRRENEPREFNIKKKVLRYENWERLYGTNVNHLDNNKNSHDYFYNSSVSVLSLYIIILYHYIIIILYH